MKKMTDLSLESFPYRTTGSIPMNRYPFIFSLKVVVSLTFDMLSHARTYWMTRSSNNPTLLMEVNIFGKLTHSVYEKLNIDLDECMAQGNFPPYIGHLLCCKPQPTTITFATW